MKESLSGRDEAEMGGGSGRAGGGARFSVAMARVVRGDGCGAAWHGHGHGTAAAAAASSDVVGRELESTRSCLPNNEA